MMRKITESESRIIEGGSVCHCTKCHGSGAKKYGFFTGFFHMLSESRKGHYV